MSLTVGFALSRLALAQGVLSATGQISTRRTPRSPTLLTTPPIWRIPPALVGGAIGAGVSAGAGADVQRGMNVGAFIGNMADAGHGLWQIGRSIHSKWNALTDSTRWVDDVAGKCRFPHRRISSPSRAAAPTNSASSRDEAVRPRRAGSCAERRSPNRPPLGSTEGFRLRGSDSFGVIHKRELGLDPDIGGKFRVAEANLASDLSRRSSAVDSAVRMAWATGLTRRGALTTQSGQYRRSTFRRPVSPGRSPATFSQVRA